MADPFNIPLTGQEITTALQATHLITKDADQVRDAINAAHSTSGSITDGGTNLVQSGTIYTEIREQIRSVIGWARYADSTYTSGSPLGTGAKTQLTINGLGTNTEISYLPTGVASLWSTAANKITPDALGDAYDVRLDFTATSTNVGDIADISFEAGSQVLAHRTLTFAKTGDTSFSIGLPLAVDQNFLTNGCSIYITPVQGSPSIYDISLFIKRDFTDLT